MVSGQNMEQIKEALQEIIQQYPNMGGVFFWEFCLAPTNWEKEMYKILN